MRYGLLSAATAAVLSLSVAAFAQSGPGGSSGSAGAGIGGGASGAGGGISGSAAGGGGAMGGAAGASSGPGVSGGARVPGDGMTTGGSSGPGSHGAAAGAASGGRSGAGETSGGGISLTSQQRIQIGRSFANVNVQPLTGVNFAITIGTVIPATVTLHEVPAEVVQVVPDYRGYRYFVVGNQIVIVEPSARRVVAVLERTT